MLTLKSQDFLVIYILWWPIASLLATQLSSHRRHTSRETSS